MDAKLLFRMLRDFSIVSRLQNQHLALIATLWQVCKTSSPNIFNFGKTSLKVSTQSGRGNIKKSQYKKLWVLENYNYIISRGLEVDHFYPYRALEQV